jgi:predicted nuclease of restriction endonuclease-like (RecB) superfamily
MRTRWDLMGDHERQTAVSSSRTQLRLMTEKSFDLMKKSKKKSGLQTVKKPVPLESQFAEVASIVHHGRFRAVSVLNSFVIDTYWKVGEYISNKVSNAEWGEGIVRQLADYLQRTLSDPKGFSDKNLWRMKKFFESYRGDAKLSPLVRELGWTQNIIILSRSKNAEEREFYLRASIKARYSKRELEHQFDSGLFERAMTSKPKLSALLKEIQPQSESIFRDSYSLHFLGLPENHSETDLRKGIVRSLKNFIIEFGRDFAFIGEEYRVQVGMKDFFLDLLFYHRELRCLVAFELKIDEFKPEYLGKLSFYLEALDRDVKKPHENPSIGIILCKGKDDEVVEYALSRTLSPAAIADYTTKLPDRRLLQNKLHEFFDLSMREMGVEYGKEGNRS